MRNRKRNCNDTKKNVRNDRYGTMNTLEKLPMVPMVQGSTGEYIQKWPKENQNMHPRWSRFILGQFTGHIEMGCCKHKKQGNQSQYLSGGAMRDNKILSLRVITITGIESKVDGLWDLESRAL